MYIIVYYHYLQDAAMDARELAEILVKLFGKDNVKLKNNRMTIEIFDVKIDFRHSDVHRMAGLNPDYFIAYNQEAINYLSGAASRVGGKRLGRLEDIGRVIFERRMCCVNATSDAEI